MNSFMQAFLAGEALNDYLARPLAGAAERR